MIHPWGCFLFLFCRDKADISFKQTLLFWQVWFLALYQLDIIKLIAVDVRGIMSSLLIIMRFCIEERDLVFDIMEERCLQIRNALDLKITSWRINLSKQEEMCSSHSMIQHWLWAISKEHFDLKISFSIWHSLSKWNCV